MSSLAKGWDSSKMMKGAQQVRLQARSLFMHTTTRLEGVEGTQTGQSLADNIHAASAWYLDKEATLVQPVLAQAQIMHYDAALDDPWIDKIFDGKNKLEDIRNGYVDFKALMGNRYRSEAVAFCQKLAQSLEMLPDAAGFKGMAAYSIRRRAYISPDKPAIADLNGTRKTPEEFWQGFLEHRTDEAGKDLSYSHIDKNTPLLLKYSRHADAVLRQGAFQPVEMVNGQLQLQPNSIMERIYQVSQGIGKDGNPDPKITMDQREAAAAENYILRGQLYNHLGHGMASILQNYTNSVMAQNAKVGYQHLLSALTMSNSPTKNMVWAMQQVMSNNPEVNQLLAKAGIKDVVDTHVDMLNPGNIRFTSNEIDMRKMIDLIGRRVTYLSALKDYVDKHPDTTWNDINEGTPKGMMARGYGLKELQNTQGTATKFSKRGGTGSLMFWMHNARMAQIGRTANQIKLATQGNPEPIIRNVMVHAALNGGKAFVDPPTAMLLNMAIQGSPFLSHDQKAQFNAQITQLRGTGQVILPGFNKTPESGMDAVDRMLNTNFSGAHAIGAAEAIPGFQFLSGHMPLDLSSAGTDWNKMTGRELVSNDEKREATLRLAMLLAPFIPNQTGMKVGQVKVSWPLIVKMVEAAQHADMARRGADEIYKGQAVPIDPRTDWMHVFTGGYGPSGDVRKQTIANQQYDRGELQNIYNQERNSATKAGNPGLFKASPGLQQSEKVYSNVYNQKPAALVKQLRQGSKRTSAPIDEEMRAEAKQYVQMQHSGVGPQALQLRQAHLQDLIRQAQQEAPVSQHKMSVQRLEARARK